MTSEQMIDAENWIRLRGVRTHNLKSLDLDLPKGKMTVVSGVSGSGKTSLLDQTLFAESRRLLSETISPQLRQVLGTESRPDIESVENLPPALILRENSHTGKDSRSLAAMTGLEEILRALLARLGKIVCSECNLPVVAQTPETVAAQVLAWPEGLRFQITYPVSDTAEESVSTSERTIQLDEKSPLGGGSLVVLDRLKTGKVSQERLIESLEQAFHSSGGTVVLLREPVPSESNSSIVELEGKRWCWEEYHKALICSGCHREFIEPHPQLFNPDSPFGACSRCEGKGKVYQFEFERVIPDETKSLLEGAVKLLTQPGFQAQQQQLFQLAEQLQLSLKEPILAWKVEERNRLWLGKPASGIQGLLGILEESFLQQSRYRTSSFRSKWMQEETCSVCDGKKLSHESLAVQLAGKNIQELLRQTSSELADFLSPLTGPSPHQETIPGEHFIAELQSRLSSLERLRVENLELDRAWSTLSSGERKRIQLAGILAAGLVNTLVILDEPARSLAPANQIQVLQAIQDLKQQGNTLLVAENSPLFREQADHHLVLGPGAGVNGGEIVAVGAGGIPPEEVPVPMKKALENQQGFIHLNGVSFRNLKHVDVRFPLRLLTVVTGVSGSGKTSLVHDSLYPSLLKHLGEELSDEEQGIASTQSLVLEEPCQRAVWLDSFQKTSGSRSVLATFLKIFPIIREEFSRTVLARSRNLQPTDFSFNTAEGGRCEECAGKGTLEIDMHFMENLEIPCSVCHGKRYRPEILEIKFRGLSMDEVLSLSVSEAFEFFRKIPAVQKRLQLLSELGLGYLELGRSLSTLSHGERQRLKLAELMGQTSQGQTVYLIDEPSAGLHPSETKKLVGCLRRLLETGNTVIVIDHQLEMIRSADYLIELEETPEGGISLGQGTPAEVISGPNSTLRDQFILSEC